jgi:hypothetical protein
MLPKTHDEAMASPEANEWETAVSAELAAQAAHGTWEVIQQVPPNKRPIGGKWVFSVKRDEDGIVERYKARLCAQGFAQRPGLDYTETFAPMCRYATLRTMLAVAASKEYTLRQMDVKTAFLNADVEEEIYMRLPKGCGDNTGKIVRLLKQLYGIKQAPRGWHLKLRDALATKGFRASDYDPALFIKITEDGPVFLLVWVDDVKIAAPAAQAEGACAVISDAFEARHVDTGIFVNLRIEQGDDGTLKVSQRHYIEQIAERFGMSDAYPKGIPLVTTARLDDCEKSPELTNEPYSELVGCLMYLASTTRPDIAHVASALGRYSAKPRRVHWHTAKDVVRYLIGTADLGLHCVAGAGTDALVQAYSDAAHASDKPLRRSMTGYVVMVNGTAVSWGSSLQRCVALSTMESEYIAACQCAREVVWLKGLLMDMGVTMKPICLFCDNEAAVSLCKNHMTTARSKHVDIQYHYVRQCVERGILSVMDCRTDRMVADSLTKAVPQHKVQWCRQCTGLV